MHHTVGAFLVISGAVSVPIGFLHQLPEGLGIALAKQIARALPAEIVPGRVTPWSAVIRLIAGKEVEEQNRLVERPATPPRLKMPRNSSLVRSRFKKCS